MVDQATLPEEELPSSERYQGLYNNMMEILDSTIRFWELCSAPFVANCIRNVQFSEGLLDPVAEGVTRRLNTAADLIVSPYRPIPHIWISMTLFSKLIHGLDVSLRSMKVSSPRIEYFKRSEMTWLKNIRATVPVLKFYAQKLFRERANSLIVF